VIGNELNEIFYQHKTAQPKKQGMGAILGIPNQAFSIGTI
jgi:hypothetical protein